MILYSIIIVNYKTPQLLLDCLQSIYSGDASRLEVIIVDNDSKDDSAQRVQSAYPAVRWIQMSYNSGFARANNEGIRQAKGNVVLLLNSDTLNEGNAIATCYERFSKSDYVGAGVQLLNRDRTPQISGNFFMKGGLNHLMALPYLGRFIRWVGLQMKLKKTNVPEAAGAVEVDWINGAFLMVKRSAIEKAGLLDEDFFLYSEEIEWCSRLRKLGPMCVYGDLHVVHLEGSSSNEAFKSKTRGYQHLGDRKGKQVMLSGLLRIRKQYGVAWFLFHLSAYIFTIPLYLLVLLMKTVLLRPGIGGEWKNWWGYSSNTMVLLRHSFLVLRNRPHFYKVL
ncbi:glycosyltransferase family 2 protein [Terrimonas sp. NA20]|uniref:Glycosyltransferase family 2 protein n=1 Tax=Terrimonas ginsenosidimutans TaxID=2908004 RepID=A0ABS9KSU2_9BACT|nr:glycosyltransferase family 2 protein [Terrimonas ginsenosidimutans]MCG2615395.1 glycosyltransferase family 2 protein [Terrimonas ginsenosidimutans]